MTERANILICGCDDCDRPAVIKRFDGSGLCLKHATLFVSMSVPEFDERNYKLEGRVVKDSSS